MYLIIALTLTRPLVYCGFACSKPQFSEKLGDAVFFNDFEHAVTVCENIKAHDSSVLQCAPLNVNAIGCLLLKGFVHFMEDLK